MEHEIRWEQRFSNFVRALNKLTQAVDYFGIIFWMSLNLLMPVI